MFQQRGRANVPMTVQTRATAVDSDTGEVTETWSDSTHVWVSLENRGGDPKGEYEFAIQASEKRVAVLDYRSDIDFSVTDTRLVSRGVTPQVVYNIVEISDRGLKHHVIELTLEEAVT